MAHDDLLRDVLDQADGYESDVFGRYALRLMALVESRLPPRLSARVDAEDIVQSAMRTFFRRHHEGRFQFGQSDDLWHLLAAITYRKMLRSIRFHRQDRRNYQREGNASPTGRRDELPPHPAPGPEEVAMITDYLEWVINQLPPMHRPVVTHRLEGQTVSEIASKLRISERTVKRVLHRARELIVRRDQAEESG